MYALRRAASFVSTRRLHTTPPRRPLRTTFLLTSTLSSGLLLGLYSDAKSCPLPPFQLAPDTTTHAKDDQDQRPLEDLLRAYVVYGLISCDTLVDYAPAMLDRLLGLFLLGPVVEWFVRQTFYGYFAGGDSAQGTVPVLQRLRRENKGALFLNSVEVDLHATTPSTTRDDRDHTHTHHTPVHKRIVAEAFRSIDVAAEVEDKCDTQGVSGRRTWVVVKMTALVPNADALRNLSLHLTRVRRVLDPPVPFPGTAVSSDLAVLDGGPPEGSPLTARDVQDLKELHDDLNKICTRAKERHVRIILDAEHSWYQPAIDAFGHALMERFNKLPEHDARRWMLGTPAHAPTEDLQPLVYVTHQAYLRRTPQHLAHALALARQHQYALGVKLVRGAYHPYELAAHAPHAIGISPDPDPPVHATKPDTDACFDASAAVLVRAIAEDVHRPTHTHAPRIGVLFATHNWASSEAVAGQLVRHGLARVRVPGGDGYKDRLVVSDDVAERLAFGQLYGMAESLSDYLVGRIESRTPCVVKYVPYGTLDEVMPYLSRRAIENKSVLGQGGAVRERKEAARRIWMRAFGGVGL